MPVSATISSTNLGAHDVRSDFQPPGLDPRGPKVVAWQRLQAAVAEAAGMRETLFSYYVCTRPGLLGDIGEPAGQVLPRPAPGTGAELLTLRPAPIRQRLVAATGQERSQRVKPLILTDDEKPDRWVARLHIGMLKHLDGLTKAAGFPAPRERLSRLQVTRIGLRIWQLLHLDSDDDATAKGFVDRWFFDSSSVVVSSDDSSAVLLPDCKRP